MFNYLREYMKNRVKTAQRQSDLQSKCTDDRLLVVIDYLLFVSRRYELLLYYITLNTISRFYEIHSSEVRNASLPRFRGGISKEREQISRSVNRRFGSPFD